MTETLTDVSRTLPDKTRLLLAVSAGGRCEFSGCNSYLLEHHLTLSPGFFGENAHIVAFSRRGPRAGEASGTAEVHQLDNLLLLCPPCHKQIDENATVYTVDVLRSYKDEHERRIHLVTGLGPDLRTEIVQLKANIGGQPVGIPAPHVFAAVAPRYPSDNQGFVIDLTGLPLPQEDGGFYAMCEKQVRRKVEHLLAEGLTTKGSRHLSIFALAPIPLLTLFGAVLGNKISADVYQRHRDTEDWCWKTAGTTVDYAFREIHAGAADGGVALALSLSGEVALPDVTARAGASATVYEIRLRDQEPRTTYLRLKADLSRFVEVFREALGSIRANHPDLVELGVFPAVPAPVAVEMGRALLPKVDPVLIMHDFDKVNGFQPRLKVNAYDPE